MEHRFYLILTRLSFWNCFNGNRKEMDFLKKASVLLIAAFLLLTSLTAFAAAPEIQKVEYEANRSSKTKTPDRLSDVSVISPAASLSGT